MNADLLIVGTSAVATMHGPPGPRRRAALGDVGLLPRGAIAIRGTKVLEVGPESRMRARYKGARTLDAEGGLVTPGFVDPHTHLPFAGDRSFELKLKLEGAKYLDILKAGGGIKHTMEATRKASLRELVRDIRLRTRTMLEWGTTTAEAKSGYGLDWAHEAKQLDAVRRASSPHGVELVPTFLGAHIVPDDYALGRKGWIEALAGHMIPAVARGKLAEFVDVFLDKGAYTRDEAKQILKAAQKAGLKAKLHADEFENRRGAELAAEIGATSCEHLLKVSSAGIRRLAKSDTVAVLLPGVAALGFMEHQAPARNLIKGGAAIALGTDFNPNCPVLTMPTILQWAVYELRMTPQEALSAATTNAAHALDRGDHIGRIVPGYRADLLIHKHPSVDELAYWVGPNPVRTVVRAGHPVIGPT